MFDVYGSCWDIAFAALTFDHGASISASLSHHSPFLVAGAFFNSQDDLEEFTITS